tara:strand:- start:15106 stop:15675 length:570 start_codon:yes stop_codon:yes gene_type:complete
MLADGDLGDTARGVPGDTTWGGADGLLIELSRLLEGGGCDWLEEAICPGIINREQLAGACYEASSNEPGRCAVDSASSVHSVQKLGDIGGYMGGERCVYCMWFGTDKTDGRDDRCEHVTRAITEWQSQDSPSIQQGSLLQIVSVGFARKDVSVNLGGGVKQFASYMRWRKCGRRDREARAKKAKTCNAV